MYNILPQKIVVFELNGVQCPIKIANCEKILVLCEALEYYYHELESFAAQHFTFTSSRTLKNVSSSGKCTVLPAGARTEWRVLAEGKI